MKRHIFILLSLILIACSSKYENELKDVELLQTKVVSLKSTFQGVDIDAVNFAKKTYYDNMDKVEKYYQPDSISMGFGILLNKYKVIKKAGNNIDQLYLNYSTDLEKMEKQLANLRQDIINNSWPIDSVHNFIDFEKSKIDKLSENIGTFIINCDAIIETHDSLANKVKELTIVF